LVDLFRESEEGVDMRRIVRPKQFQDALGIGHSAFYEMIAAGLIEPGFPIVPGGKARGWLDSYFDEVVAKRAAAGRGEYDDSDDRARMAPLQAKARERTRASKAKAERDGKAA
jgi:predicted DNA-binding transcriptional regulator AlpA